MPIQLKAYLLFVQELKESGMFDRVNTVIVGKTAGVADVDAPAGNVLAVVDIPSELKLALA